MAETLYRPELSHEPEIKYSSEIAESEISHLIQDFDDIDEQKAIMQYEKVQERENIKS